MPGYHNKFPNASTSALPSQPPDYELEMDEEPELPPSRFKIIPREEEGREELPPYSCTLHKEAMFERKMELSNPFERADKRRWKKVYLVLHGTKLDVHKPKRVMFFGKKSKTSGEAEYTAGALLESYTLQLAEVGTAADYTKKNYVIRLRAQDQQFLLSCVTLEPFLEWLEALAAAIDLSPSLEERSLPRNQTLPRRRRRRNQATGANATTQQDGSQESGTRQEGERDAGDEPFDPAESPHMHEMIETRRRQNNAPENTFDEEGKWCPRRRITPEANLRYAKRCMAVLCGDAPRQSDFVIVQGKRYRLSWTKRKMIPDVGGASKEEVSDNKGKRPATATGAGDDAKAAQKLPKLPEYDEIMGLKHEEVALAVTTTIC
ncbi:hypothetical protein EDC01DRAFT_782217 [Geopyxis carbonaria]|nr:hypothetical protein EDC01DRAFT_782217 [Geopyxis carbonaria]